MKKLALLSTALLVLLAACETKTEKVVTPTETTQTTTVTTPSVDTAAVEGAARDAAHETGTAMETAGRELQEEAKTDTK